VARATNFSIAGSNVSISQEGSAEPVLRIVSAASYQPGPLAPASLAALFGAGLGGASVSIHDAQANDLAATTLYTSASQINFAIPPGAALGSGLLNVQTAGGLLLSTPIEIAAVSPGVFSLDSAGLVAADVVRVSGGIQTLESVYQMENGALVPRPIDLGPPGDQVYLEIYGTGLRAAGTAATVAIIGSVPASVTYAGPQGTYLGTDQINLLIPRSLAGAGLVPIDVTAEGVAANQVYVAIQ
jgi:uncharacterized protein (TIGR03437 family)